MNARVDHVLDEVLALPAAERSAVAVALLDSLEVADDAGISDAWRAEIRQRRDAMRIGTTNVVPWAEVRQRLSAL